MNNFKGENLKGQMEDTIKNKINEQSIWLAARLGHELNSLLTSGKIISFSRTME